MDLGFVLHSLIPSWNSVIVLVIFFVYLAIFGSILPGKLVPGVILQDGSRLYYRCNGLLSLLLLVALLGIGTKLDLISPTVISERGLELLSATFIFSVLLYILDYFFYEEYMTSTWDIIAERLGFMLVFGDLVWIPFTFSIQGWWLLGNKVELTTVAVIANCIVFLIGYLVFRGANKQKHVFKKNPKALIWGKPPMVIGGKLLASGYWGIARHCNYLGDLLLALSFSLPCGISSPVPYFYPIYLLILLIWRERRDEARCAEKYKEIWAEYRALVPWRILPYFY
ncbi:C-14 sterol reductase, putative [Ricinus communis]|uniref:Delta(14)-sterol reductase n=1 Tax=Ricinus communis TaxID=3988 RepID=B9SRG4_RICCO|nr:C-14 sterol reductase, putative [Ricinus communis]